MPRRAAFESIAEHVIPGAGHAVIWDAPEQTAHVPREILANWTSADEEKQA